VKSGRKNFNNFRKFLFVTVHIVAHPFTITEEIVVLFTILREQILTQVSIKAGRAIIASFVIMKRSIISALSFTFRSIKSFISPETTYIAPINKVLNFISGVIVSAKNTTRPLRIPVIM
jgi:hypothetical protein